MKGRRKSFVEPFKLFLVISIIYFILLPFGGEPAAEKITPVISDSTILQAVNTKTDLNKVNYSLQGITVSKAGMDSIKNEIDSTGLKRYVEKHYAKEPGWTKLLIRQTLKIMISTGQSLTTVLEHTASKLIFLLIPVFAVLLKLFYLRRNRLYFEHLIFSLHLHAFIFLLFIVYLLIELIVPGKPVFHHNDHPGLWLHCIEKILRAVIWEDPGKNAADQPVVPGDRPPPVFPVADPCGGADILIPTINAISS